MEDLFAAGGIGAVLRELKPLLHLDCLTVTGETLGERLSRARRLGRSRGRAPVGRAAIRRWRAGRAIRLAGAERRHHQALRRRPEAVRARRPGRGVRLARRSVGAHRRSRSRRDRRRLSGAAECRPEERLAMPEAGYLPIPAKLARAGRQGHGAHFRRAHERHRLRHHRAARLAGSGGRRPARRWCATATASGFRCRDAASICWSPTTNSPSGARPPTAAATPERGYARLYMQSVLQAEAGCDFDFLRKA